MSDTPTVFVVDPDGGSQQRAAGLCRTQRWAVQAGGTGGWALREIGPRDAGCLLLEMELPDRHGLDLYRDLRWRGVSLPVVFVADRPDYSVAIRAMKAGASNYLAKSCHDHVLTEALREGLRLDAQGREQRRRFETLVGRVRQLTAREREVMNRVVRGRLNKEIAGEFGVSPKTVEVHRSRVMEKMKAQSLAGLVRMAVALESAAGLPVRLDGVTPEPAEASPTNGEARSA